MTNAIFFSALDIMEDVCDATTTSSYPPLALLGLPDELLFLILHELHDADPIFMRQTMPQVNKRFAALLNSDHGMWQSLTVPWNKLAEVNRPALCSWAASHAHQISDLRLVSGLGGHNTKSIDDRSPGGPAVLTVLLAAGLEGLTINRLHLNSSSESWLHCVPFR